MPKQQPKILSFSIQVNKGNGVSEEYAFRATKVNTVFFARYQREKRNVVIRTYSLEVKETLLVDGEFVTSHTHHYGRVCVRTGDLTKLMRKLSQANITCIEDVASIIKQASKRNYFTLRLEGEKKLRKLLSRENRATDDLLETTRRR